MNKKKIIALLTTIIVSGSLVFAGVNAISATADESKTATDTETVVPSGDPTVVPSGDPTVEPSGDPTVEPGTTDPTKPGTTDPTESEDPSDPTESEDPSDPTKPGTTDPTKPGTTDPTESEDPSDPTESEDPSDPTKPGTTDPTKPGTTDPTKPGTTEESTTTVVFGTDAEYDKDNKTEVVEVTTDYTIISKDLIDTAEADGAETVTIKNTQLGVQVDIPLELLAQYPGATLKINKVAKPSNLSSVKSLKQLLDLDLKDANGKKIDFKTTPITISFVTSADELKEAGIDLSKAKVFYFDGNAIDSWFDTTINKDYKVTFTTGHFSIFGLGEYSSTTSGSTATASTKATSKKTGDSNALGLIATVASGALAVSAVAGTAVMRKKRENN